MSEKDKFYNLGENYPKRYNFWKISISILVILFAAILIINIFPSFQIFTQKISSKILTSHVSPSLVKPVLAKDIYPLFFCPCCGQPLDPKKICCGMAKAEIDYIDSLVSKNLSEKEIILAFVKQYGMNSLVDRNKANEIRDDLIKAAPADRPIISLTPSSYDLGNVSQKKGIVTTFFELKNEGKSDLIINKMDTSCGCTSAAIVFNGEEGPRFAMPGHGTQNPTDWQVIIPAGQVAQLKVYYDPDVHKDFRGFAIREISVYSNDPIDFEKKVRIELNQVD